MRQGLLRRFVATALVVAAALGCSAPPSLAEPATGHGAPTETVDVVRVVPNPVAADDRGESVTLSVPPDTDLGRFVLGDGERRVTLPNRTVGGRVTLTAAPAAVTARTGQSAGTVVRVDLPALANGGDDVRLFVDGVAVSSVRYPDAPEGAAYRPAAGEFRPIGASTFPVRSAGGGPATAFVLPDAPGPPVRALRATEDRVLLAGYTITSGRVADALVAAARRGVRVRVLADGAPVGGLARSEARLLDRLVDSGVEVRVVGGTHARYDFHHAKYAVADDRAVVLTENWKPVGTGGNGSRGWGVAVRDGETAAALAETFRADFRARGAQPWSVARATYDEFQAGTPANGSYPSRFPPAAVSARRVRVLVAPDNAERAVLGRLDAADESIRVLQATAGGSDQPFVRALVRAARRGVRVRVLLSGAWYAREENRAVVRALNRRAAREGLDLEAKLADPRGRYATVHAKGVVVDDTVLVGSLNWNNHSARENREVVLAVRSEGAARYFARVFRADWRGGAWRVPAGLLVALAAAAGVALRVATGVEFEEGSEAERVGGDRVGW